MSRGADKRPIERDSDSLHRTDCVCAASRRVARAVTQLYDLVLAPVGLKATQFVLLQAIAEHGEIPQFRLAREYAVAVETLSRRLSNMRTAGWVQVRIGRKRKERFYSLTPEGLRIVREAKPHWARAQQRLADVLGVASRLNELVESLDILACAAADAQRLRTPNLSEKNAISLSECASVKSVGAGGTESESA